MAPPQFRQFDPNVETWASYVGALKMYFSYNDIEDKKQVSALLLFMGPSTYQSLENALFPDEPQSKKFDELVKLVEQNLNPGKTKYSFRHDFRQVLQAPGEGIQDYAARLKKATIRCEWSRDELKVNLLEQFTFGLRSQEHLHIKQKLVSEMGKTIEDFETAVREAVSLQGIERVTAQSAVHKVSARRAQKHKFPSSSAKTPMASATVQRSCFRCGSSSHIASSCSHASTVCRKCNKKGHLQKVCRGGKPHPGSSLPVLSLDIVSVNTSNSGRSQTPITVQVKIENRAVLRMEVDTGSGVSTMPVQRFDKVFADFPRESPDVMLRTASGQLVLPNSMVKIQVEYNDQVKPLTLYLLDDPDFPVLLGRSWLRHMRLPWDDLFPLAVDNSSVVHTCSNTPIEVPVTSVQSSSPTLYGQAILSEFPGLLESGIGKFSGPEQRLSIVDDVRPVFHRFRPPPYALMDPIEQELNSLVRDDIIEKVDASEWATPIVVIPKAKNRVRICGDFKATVNRFLRVDQHPMPRMDEIFFRLRGGVEYTVLDIHQAYLHIVVAPEDREMLTITTHLGLYRYKRLAYGLASAPAIWQRTIESILAGVEGLGILMDDLVITGPNHEVHRQRVRQVLQKLQDAGLRINADKCKFFQKSVEYCGFRIDANGIHKQDDKIRAMRDAPVPKNVSELKSFVGFVQYYSVFTDKLAEYAHPLYALLCQGVKYEWTAECDEAFRKIKAEMISDRVLVSFDPNLPIVLATDASPYGISAVLSHVLPEGAERPIAYYSRHLTATEQRYSQIDKEALGIKEGVRRFFQYLYGRRFTLQTDSKPLVSIFSPDKGLPALSATRMLHYAVFLMGFSYDIVYRNTKDHGNADALSRLPQSSEALQELSGTSVVQDDPIATFQVNQIQALSTQAANVATATAADTELNPLLEILRGRKAADRFLTIPIEEFTLQDGCILRGHRVVVPASLRSLVLEELHEGHFGSQRMRSLARHHVWWPSIDRDIGQITKECVPCIHHYKAPVKPVLHSWEPAKSAWSRIHIDFAQPRDCNYFLLIVVDAFSKWPEAFVMKSTTSTATMEILDDLFARYGLPDELVSDNGPQLVSAQFENFLRERGIRHKTTPQYFPATNGQAERFVQTIKGSLLRSLEGKPSVGVAVHLRKTLSQIRIQENDTTNKAPCELFLGRRTKSLLDLLRPSPQPVIDFNVATAKFQTGQRVAARNYVTGPKWRVGEITKVRGPRTYDVKVGQRFLKRHESQLRAVSPKAPLDCDSVARNAFLPTHLSGPLETIPETVPEVHEDVSQPHMNSEPPVPRRSGRVPKAVVRLNL
jgi:hypothetical protein